MRASFTYLGHAFLQEGDGPSWNLQRGGVQAYWPCSEPAHIYREGVIMAAIMLMKTTRVRTLANQIYGAGEGFGKRADHAKYAGLLQAIQEARAKYKFVITVPFHSIPDHFFAGVAELGLQVAVATNL